MTRTISSQGGNCYFGHQKKLDAQVSQNEIANIWVEVGITLGVFVVSVLLKPALMIEQRYEMREGKL